MSWWYTHFPFLFMYPYLPAPKQFFHGGWFHGPWGHGGDHHWDHRSLEVSQALADGDKLSAGSGAPAAPVAVDINAKAAAPEETDKVIDRDKSCQQ